MNVELPGRACVHSSDCGSSLICDADAHLCLIPAGGSCHLTKHCAAEYFCDWHDKCDCPWLQQKFGDHCEHLRGSSWWAVASRFLTIVLYCPALFVASEGMLVECVRMLILWKQGTTEDSHWMALFSLGLNMLACLFNLIFAVFMVMDMLEVGGISKGLSEEMAFVFEGGALTFTLVVIIHMILLWIQLCLTTQTLQRDKFRAMRRFLICFITACVTARLIFTTLEWKVEASWYYLNAIVALVSLLVAFCAVKYRTHLTHKILQAITKESPFVEMQKRISRVASILEVGLVLALVGVLCAGISFYFWQLEATWIFFCIGHLGTALALLACAWFGANQLTTRSRRAARRVLQEQASSSEEQPKRPFLFRRLTSLAIDPRGSRAANGFPNFNGNRSCGQRSSMVSRPAAASRVTVAMDSDFQGKQVPSHRMTRKTRSAVYPSMSSSCDPTRKSAAKTRSICESGRGSGGYRIGMRQSEAICRMAWLPPQLAIHLLL
ncbi:hypothetical protein AB1Y20_009449 [Prymnesium parvum]|uniref:EGF-like domain-containing protein n=1 Tax=Prymnesium parvum TaxID=97485 RepID=A0AB34K4C7_PRYPA